MNMDHAMAESPHIAVASLRLMVNFFFHCEECRERFMKVPFTEDEIKGPKDAALWMWNAHNEVNHELHQKEQQYVTMTWNPNRPATRKEPSPYELVTSDPAFPKHFWPPRDVCPTCYREVDETESGGTAFHIRDLALEDGVFRFLHKNFYRSKGAYAGEPPKQGKKERKDRGDDDDRGPKYRNEGDWFSKVGKWATTTTDGDAAKAEKKRASERASQFPASLTSFAAAQALLVPLIGLVALGTFRRLRMQGDASFVGVVPGGKTPTRALLPTRGRCLDPAAATTARGDLETRGEATRLPSKIRRHPTSTPYSWAPGGPGARTLPLRRSRVPRGGSTRQRCLP